MESVTDAQVEEGYAMNPAACDDDFWIERRERMASRQTPEQNASDVEYFQHKLFASFHVSKEYL